MVLSQLESYYDRTLTHFLLLSNYLVIALTSAVSLHKIADLLKSNTYLKCILIKYSKIFIAASLFITLLF